MPKELTALSIATENRIPDLVIFLLCLLIAIFAVITINPHEVGLNHDDGIYVILGKALSAGDGMRLVNLPSSPYQVKYPIVYPFLISLVWSWLSFPANIFWIKLLNVGLLFGILLETYYLVLKQLDGNKLLAMLTTVLAGTSVYVLYYSTRVHSEIPYLFFSLTAVICFLKSDAHETAANYKMRKYALYCLTILFTTLAFQTKAVGLALLMGLFSYLLIKKQKAWAAGFLILFAALNLPWIIWVKNHSPSPEINPLLRYYIGYHDFFQRAYSLLFDLATLRTVVLENILSLYEKISILLSNVSNGFWPLMVIVWAIFSAGVWNSLRTRTFLPVNLYLAFYVAAFVCIPSLPSSHLRYLVPVAPFLFGIFFHGVATLLRSLTTSYAHRRLKFYFTALLTILLLPNPPTGIWAGLKLRNNPAWEGFEETVSWIKEHTDEDAVLAAAYDPFYYLYTGRTTLRPWINDELIFYSPSPRIDNPDYYMHLLRMLNVQYLVEERLAGVERKPVQEFYSTMIRRHRDKLKLVFVSKDQLHKIYQIHYTDH